jgi:hypothetical protein
MDKYELGEKKFNITRGGSQKKNYMGEKQNSSTLQGVKTQLPKKKYSQNL